jgi:hypothetical protein
MLVMTLQKSQVDRTGSGPTESSDMVEVEVSSMGFCAVSVGALNRSGVRAAV